MTAADPRDGLPELPQPSLLHVNEPREFYTADQMLAYAEQCIAHARPEAVDSLAADQQKGGGEVFGWWCATGRGGFIRNDGTEEACEHCAPLYVTPQPSIPAPAQQDGKASETIQTSNFPSPQFAPGRPQFAGGCFGFDITSFGENCPGLRMYVEDDGCWHYKTSFSTFWIDDLIGQLTAAKTVLAHPPHADQETQG